MKNLSEKSNQFEQCLIRSSHGISVLLSRKCMKIVFHICLWLSEDFYVLRMGVTTHHACFSHVNMSFKNALIGLLRHSLFFLVFWPQPAVLGEYAWLYVPSNTPSVAWLNNHTWFWRCPCDILITCKAAPFLLYCIFDTNCLLSPLKSFYMVKRSLSSIWVIKI